MKLIKLVLVAILLLCLLKMPYGYYRLVRFASLVGFGILGYASIKEDKQNLAVAYFALALLFQPMFKIALGRTIWNIVDVAVAFGLLVTILIDKRTSNVNK